jgi:RNA polymerase sigma-70 factor, ECF subfamily
MSERALLEAARAGDEDAFRSLIEPHRERVHAHCYRMLNSVQDAEDAFQETLLRAWRGLDSFRGRSTIGSWLYTIATNACLRILETRHKRPLGLDAELAEELSDPGPTPEAGYEQRETAELAFAAVLRYLPARQRVVLVLREVLAFTAAESAEILATTAQAVNSALQRARRTLDERFAELREQAASEALGEALARVKAERLAASLAQGDVAAIVAGLDERAPAMSLGPVRDLTLRVDDRRHPPRLASPRSHCRRHGLARRSDPAHGARDQGAALRPGCGPGRVRS